MLRIHMTEFLPGESRRYNKARDQSSANVALNVVLLTVYLNTLVVIVLGYVDNALPSCIA